MIEPSGAMSVSIDGLRTLISESAAFQSWVNAADAAEALDHIYVEGVPGGENEDVDALRPFAMVCFDSLGDGLLSYYSGILMMMFESDISEEYVYSHTDAAYEFTNNVGAVLEDVREESYTPGRLFIREIASVQRPARSDPKEDGGRYMQMWFRVAYGLEPV